VLTAINQLKVLADKHNGDLSSLVAASAAPTLTRTASGPRVPTPAGNRPPTPTYVFDRASERESTRAREVRLALETAE